MRTASLPDAPSRTWALMKTSLVSLRWAAKRPVTESAARAKLGNRETEAVHNTNDRRFIEPARSTNVADAISLCKSYLFPIFGKSHQGRLTLGRLCRSAGMGFRGRAVSFRAVAATRHSGRNCPRRSPVAFREIPRGVAQAGRDRLQWMLTLRAVSRGYRREELRLRQVCSPTRS